MVVGCRLLVVGSFTRACHDEVRSYLTFCNTEMLRDFTKKYTKLFHKVTPRKTTLYSTQSIPAECTKGTEFSVSHCACHGERRYGARSSLFFCNTEMLRDFITKHTKFFHRDTPRKTTLYSTQSIPAECTKGTEYTRGHCPNW